MESKTIILKREQLERMFNNYAQKIDDTSADISYKLGAREVINQILIFGKEGTE